MRMHLLLTLILFTLVPQASAADLDFGNLKATPIMVTSITLAEGAVVPVPFGESVQLVAETYPEGKAVQWTVHAEGDSKAKARINSSGLVTAIAREENESGLVRVSASIQGGVAKEVLVYVGCQTCSTGQCQTPGKGFIQIGSIDIRLSLGKAENGIPAGALLLKSDKPLALLSTPAALSVSSLSKNVETLYQEKVLRQIITPQTFIDIDQSSPFEYQIFFYNLTDKGALHDGLYQVDSMAMPIAVWQIENPSESSDDITTLLITEYRSNGHGKTLYEYNYDEEGKTWHLSSGNGLRQESRKEYKDRDNNRVVRTTVSDPDTQVISVTEKVFHDFAWGEELISETNDPDGSSLSTRISYYEEQGTGYSKVRSRIEPNSSWVRYQYDVKGRIVKKVSSWLDAEIESSDDQVKVILNDYTLVNETDSNLERDSHRPRKTTELIQGIVASKSFNLYTTSANGERTNISEQCVSQDCNYGDSGNLRSVTITHPVGIQGAKAGKIKSMLSSSKQLTSYFYERGTFTPAADPAQSVFRFLAILSG